MKDIGVNFGEIGYGVSRIGSINNHKGLDPVTLKNATVVLQCDPLPPKIRTKP